ncbi:MAG TPA: CocE/NonD family hydrolase [Blastocatellia bacterium]|nr:CocE/NonD family hydrolase [Blastocatellia bacterium]
MKYKSKLFSLLTLLILSSFLLIPCRSSVSHAQLEFLVDESTHFIQVPAGTFGSGTITLAATVYQPRFFPSAPAAIYIHGFGGHRLTGEDNLGYYIAATGYIVVSYTARGFGHGESGGRVTLAGPDEMEDLRHVIDWLTTDPDHVIGPRVTRVGVLGGSYGGAHSFQIASDPRVSAVIPLVGWTDLEEALYPNGAIKYKLGIAEFYSGLDQSVGRAPFYNFTQFEFDLFDGAAEGRVAGNVKQALRDRSIAHMNADGQEVLDPSRKPRVPTFIIQSWDDYLFPSTQVMDVFPQITAPKQIYFGRHGHPPGGNRYEGEDYYIATQVISWFDHYLRDLGGTNSLPVTSAPAPLSVLPFTASQLPSNNISSSPLFLKAGGILSRKKKGPVQEETAGGIFRPERIRSSHLGTEIPSQADMFSGHAEALPGLPQHFEYTFAPWETETEMLGASEFSLFVSSATSADVDIAVRTFDVAPDGSETEVTIGAMRVLGLKPGEIRRVTFRDFGDDWVFAAGHSLRLKLSNIDFPDFRPPGANDNLRSEITIHTGKAFPSSMWLPVRTR